MLTASLRGWDFAYTPCPTHAQLPPGSTTLTRWYSFHQGGPYIDTSRSPKAERTLAQRVIWIYRAWTAGLEPKGLCSLSTSCFMSYECGNKQVNRLLIGTFHLFLQVLTLKWLRGALLALLDIHVFCLLQMLISLTSFRKPRLANPIFNENPGFF